VEGKGIEALASLPALMAKAKNTSKFPALLVRLRNLPALGRLAAGGGAAVLAYLLTPANFETETRYLISFVAFALALIAVIIVAMATADRTHIHMVANQADPGRYATFVFAVLLCSGGLFSVGFLLQGLREMGQDKMMIHIVVAIAAMAEAWVLLHLMFSLRYAHMYFDERQQKESGLQFPGDEPNSYWDFAYFSFTIGMTAQTSDVGVCNPLMRRVVLVHGLLSFAFNTAVVALGVNLLSSSLSR